MLNILPPPCVRLILYNLQRSQLIHKVWFYSWQRIEYWMGIPHPTTNCVSVIFAQQSWVILIDVDPSLGLFIWGTLDGHYTIRETLITCEIIRWGYQCGFSNVASIMLVTPGVSGGIGICNIIYVNSMDVRILLTPSVRVWWVVE